MSGGRYSEQAVREAVAVSASLTEALRQLGLRPAGGNHATLRSLIERLGISTAHFDPGAARRNPHPRPIPLAEVLVEGSTYCRRALKQRLYASGLKARQCELCGQGEIWRGRRMSLILDHINGIPDDNRLENLRVVCPNCAATLETHCGRKNRLRLEARACARCGKEFTPKYRTHRYCSRDCGQRSRRSRKPRPEARKVPRPSREQLMHDLETMSFLAVGRKYAVSDNAVRKWIRWYDDQGDRSHRAMTPSTNDQQA